MEASRPNQATAVSTFVLLVCGTALGFAGTDLVLPAIPSLPDTLGGDPATAQLVLAAFVAGFGVGLFVFGELGARFDQRALLAASLAGYAATSAASALAPGLEALVGVRAIQGMFAAAPAVFAPGMIRALFEPRGALRALGLLGSIEAIVPAIAPIFGAWLVFAFDWRGSFWALALCAAAAAGAVWLLRGRMPAIATRRGGDGYGRLLIDPVYLRYALSHAFTLGGLLVFVFGVPAVVTGPLDGAISDFITMQVCGVASFIVSANLSARLSERHGPEPLILWGSVLCAGASAAILIYALTGGGDPLVVTALFVPMNFGLGFRGPPGFFQAVLAARDDDARGAALVLLGVLFTTAVGTAVAAPFITVGLAPLAAVAATISAGSIASLVALPRLAP